MKYKTKYLQLKHQIGGDITVVKDIFDHIKVDELISIDYQSQRVKRQEPGKEQENELRKQELENGLIRDAGNTFCGNLSPEECRSKFHGVIKSMTEQLQRNKMSRKLILDYRKSSGDKSNITDTEKDIILAIKRIGKELCLLKKVYANKYKESYDENYQTDEQLPLQNVVSNSAVGNVDLKETGKKETSKKKKYGIFNKIFENTLVESDGVTREPDRVTSDYI